MTLPGNDPNCNYFVTWDWYQDCYYATEQSTIPTHCDAVVVYNVQSVLISCNEGGGGGGGDDVPGCPGLVLFETGECIVEEPLEPIAPLDSLIKQFCNNISEAQKTLIKNAINEYKNSNCATKYIYSHFDNVNKSFEFCISAGAGSGSYSSTTKSFNFTSNEAASNMYVMEHEFIHAFQDDTYAGGIAQYGKNQATGSPNPGFVNIEFEQAVMNDMINYGNTLALTGASSPQIASYKAWIDLLTNDGTTYPKIHPGGAPTEIAIYNTFMLDYNYYLNIYNGFSGNNSTALNLSPQALIKLFNNINRNCP